MKPCHEREILDVPEIAHCYESDRDKERPSPVGACVTALLRILTPFTSHPSRFEKRQQFHATTVMAVVPSGESDERNVLVGELCTSVRFAVVWRHAEMGRPKTCLEAFFTNEPT
jgi:hypothetical protein